MLTAAHPRRSRHMNQDRTLKLDYKRVVVVVGLHGPDEITVTFDAKTPFPAMGYEASAKIQTAKGYGVEWCRIVLGVEPDEIIDAS